MLLLVDVNQRGSIASACVDDQRLTRGEDQGMHRRHRAPPMPTIPAVLTQYDRLMYQDW
jgi:hypothetical protein